MGTLITVAIGSDFYLTGEEDGQGIEKYIDLTCVVGPCTAAPDPAHPQGSICLALATPLRIPAFLVASGRFKTQAEIDTDLTAVGDKKHELVAQVADAARRMCSIDVNASAAGTRFLGVTTPFGAAGAFAGAGIRLRFWETTLDTTPPGITVLAQASIELAAHARLVVAGLTRAVSFAIEVRQGLTALLHVGADDLGLRFPAFECPSFDLTAGPLAFKLADGLQNGQATLKRFAFDVAAKLEVSQTNEAGVGSPVLVLRKNGADVDWAIAGNTFNPVADDLATTSKIAEFDIRIVGAGGHVDITGLKLGKAGAADIFGGTVSVHMPAISVPDRTIRMGPLEIGWHGVTVVPSHEGNQFGSTNPPPASGPTLRLRVHFERLTLLIPDDMDAFLHLRGTVEIDPSGTRVIALELLAPFPLQLVAAAATDLERAMADGLRLVLDFASATAAQLAQLMTILGRFATAIGRAAVFIGSGLVHLGELVARGLGAAAELIGTLLRRLVELMPAPDVTQPKLAIELRIGTAPLELRQVLVTLREGTPAGASLNALGLRVDINQSWRVGLLFDFAARPGTYLILTPAASPAAAGPVVSLSTDLWLDQGERTRALHDVDGTRAGPAPRDEHSQPILRLDLSLTPPGEVLVVLAGLSGGETTFLQRITGETTSLTLPGGAQVRTIDGPIRLEPLADHFDLQVHFEKDRILPLLGMGETGTTDAGAPPPTEPNFLDKLRDSIANVVWVKESDAAADLKNRQVTLKLLLGLKAGGLESSIDLNAALSLDTLALRVQGGNSMKIQSQRIEEEALGLVWVIEQKDAGQRQRNDKIDMFELAFAGGQTGLALLDQDARMELRFNALSSDGKGVVFKVSEFSVGSGGLNLTARVDPNPVVLNGIDVPFRFTEGELVIKNSRLVHAGITGRGTLPRDLIGEADCTIALAFGQSDSEGFILQSGTVQLDKKNDPIVCHSTRFTLTVTDLDIGIVKDGGYHFFYLVTGSLRFTPKSGEFSSGLLQFLDGVEMDLERTPLAADPRVLLQHISFQKALNPKKSFNLFNLFTFELRGFGYHPASPKFGGAPAVNISGQIKFVEIGDVMQPNIDFHGLWIAPPASGESLPRIKADGLGIDLNLKGAIRVRGSVVAVDPDTRTVEGRPLVADDYNAYGFLGSGEFDIPGWGTMGATLGFLELERKDRPGERRKSFFFYANQNKLAVEIPAVVWTFYLREAGFGLGFRYTLDALQTADRATSVPKLISAMDEVAKTQGDLHKFSAWKPETDGDRVTLALKGVIQAYPASKNWDVKNEEAAENPFLFDLVAAIRSDFSLFMGLRGWVGTNYIDYMKDDQSMRSHPGMRGYLYINGTEQRLLARMIGDSKGYIGKRLPALGEGQPLRKALQSVDWSATLYIKPGLFHYELGWPNQLAVRLVEQDNMRLTVRGGMIFRAADDGLLWGYNIEADGFFRFGGEVRAGSVGVSAYATLQASLVARVLCYLSWRFTGSLVYGLIALEAALEVAFRAWMEVDLGFTSFTIEIGFSCALQLSATAEVAITTSAPAVRVNARVGVSVFGCTLSVGIGFTTSATELEKARAQVQRFLAMSLTADEPDVAPAAMTADGDARVEQDARHAEAPRQARPATQGANDNPALPPTVTRSHLGQPPQPTRFWSVLRTQPGNASVGYAMLVPQESSSMPGGASDFSAFYAPGIEFIDASNDRDESVAAHWLEVPIGTPQADLDMLAQLSIFNPFSNQFEQLVPPAPGGQLPILARWNAVVPDAQKSGKLTLAVLFDECYLADTTWSGTPPIRRTALWHEPPARVHARPVRLSPGTPEQRNSARDMAQRGHAATAAADPVVDGVHQTRAIVLGMFSEQFFAFTGQRPGDAAHVTDLGLVFRGPIASLEKLSCLRVRKHDSTTDAGAIATFNPPPSWFVNDDPLLANDSSARTANGIQLNWQLHHRFTHDIAFGLQQQGVSEVPAQGDPEHYLRYYEIVRTLEGDEFTPRTIQVKPACTLGAGEPAKSGNRMSRVTVKTIAPECQFNDDLSDLPPELRSALLPGSDPAAALAAAFHWQHKYPNQQTVALSYTVTPVDVAGTRGLPKSFLVWIDQPVVPLQPAEAELRFIVSRLSGESSGPHRKAEPPNDALAVVLALKDPSPFNDTVVHSKRSYRLIAHREAVAPSGYYGVNGVTESSPSMKGVPVASPDDVQWELDAGAFVSLLGPDGKVPVDTFIDPLEPNHDTLTAFSLWRLLAGCVPLPRVQAGFGHASPPVQHGGTTQQPDEQEFLRQLWSHKGRRIATRFSLETIVTSSRTIDGTNVTVETVSARTPVAIEVRIEPADPARCEIGLLRPEAFEWPVHLELPPHRPGQVTASSGFARFRAPPSAGLLANLVDKGGKKAVCLVRDPERRILTQVRFAAVPAFAAEAHGAVDAMHASAVAGFDVHELDLDELAALDTGQETGFEYNAVTWQRARRVARIERVPRDKARLLPDNNRDWLGWQAHYPSETWRLEHRSRGRGAGAVPRRAGWYSAAESAPVFAKRIPRMRLFPTVSEAAVAALMADGLPNSVKVTLRATGSDADSKAVAAQILNGTLSYSGLAFGEENPPSHLQVASRNDDACFRLHPPGTWPEAPSFSVARLRAALLGMQLQLPGLDVRLLGIAGLSVSVTVEGWSGSEEAGYRTGSIDLPLALAGPMHPILEEVLGELEYSAGHDSLYRRYTIAIQPVQGAAVADLAGFLGATSAETDPYGWSVLQQLGLACTVRFYDRDEDQFVAPQLAVQRIRRVFSAVVKRYQPPGDTDFGVPFVDVLLRPGHDRTPGPFDAVLASAGVELESDDLRLDDDALAIVQLALRPAPGEVRQYSVLTAYCEPAVWPVLLNASATDERPAVAARVLTGYALEFDATVVGEVICLEDGSRTVLDGTNKRVALPVFPKGKIGSASAQRGFTLFLRQFTGADPAPACKLKARVNEFDPTNTTKPASEYLLTMDELEPLVVFSGNDKSAYPKGKLLDQAGNDAIFEQVKEPPISASRSPYGRFAALPVEDWTAALEADSAGMFATLRQNLACALPAVDSRTPEPKEVSASYVPWMLRFLDHAAAPCGHSQDVRFALAAPGKSDPLHIASDADDMLSVAFLHADRWAHARAYAVRPTPRYQNLALSAGCYGDQAESERLVSPALLEQGGGGYKFAQPVGYALALSPRTERIEPPVILGSRLLQASANTGGEWELVLARHGEENLAFSNRSLFACLGTEGTAISFVREYRDPSWPRRLSTLLAQGEQPLVYPEREAVLPVAPSSARIDDAALGALDSQYPALWKGADVWRVRRLPAHYRVGALAVARAGLVVSRVVASLQESTPRRPLDPELRAPGHARDEANKLLGWPKLAIRRENPAGAARIVLEDVRMVSHADVSQTDAQDWFTGGVRDVAWWPDPGVRYTLLRRGQLGGARTFEDEDAEVALVAAPLPGDTDQEAKPLVVRCRGTRFAPGADAPSVTFTDRADKRTFNLRVDLALTAPLDAARERIRLEQAGTEQQTIDFNAAALHFAQVMDTTVLTVDFTGIPQPSTVPDAQAWLQTRAADLDAWAATLDNSANLQPVCAALRRLAQDILTEAASLPANPDYPHLCRPRASQLELSPPYAAAEQAVAFQLSIASQGQFVVLKDFPTDGEAAAAIASRHPAALPDASLWRVYRERLLGAGRALALRAVDTRNAAVRDRDGKWSAPGEAETAVGLPAWAK